MEPVTVWLGKLSPNERKIQGYILKQDGRQDPGCLRQPWNLTFVGPRTAGSEI